MASSMETQEAIRRQALEMQDSIKELQKFAEQARKKDAALKAAAARRPKTPVITNDDGKALEDGDTIKAVAGRNADRTAAAKQRTGKQEPDAGFSFDRGSGSTSTVDPAQRDSHRERGNALFKDGKYDLAREAYTASLGVKATHLAFANRAMASLKLRDFAAAEADCTSAIDLEPSYIKAYQRRAAARAEQGNHMGAIADLEYAARMQPGSKALAAERAAAIDRYHAESGTPKPCEVQEIHIRAEGGSEPSAAAAEGQQPAAAAAAEQPAEAAADTPVQPAKDASPTRPSQQQQQQPASPVSPAAATPTVGPLASPGSKPTQAVSPASAPAQLPDAAALCQDAVPSRSSPGVKPTAAPGRGVPGNRAASPVLPKAAQASNAAESEHAPEQNGHAAAVPSARVATTAAAEPPRPGSVGGMPLKLKRPATGLDFERTWRSLAGQQEQQAQYLLLLRPQQLPTLLQASLTAPLLASLLPPLLSLLAEECDADHAVDLLAKLPEVPRFQLAAMSLSGPGKAAMSVLWDERSRKAAGGSAVNNVHLMQRLANLKSKYQL